MTRPVHVRDLGELVDLPLDRLNLRLLLLGRLPRVEAVGENFACLLLFHGERQVLLKERSGIRHQSKSPGKDACVGGVASSSGRREGEGLAQKASFGHEITICPPAE